MPWATDIERHRARRTLSEVKRKFEEALALSKQNGDFTPVGSARSGGRSESTLTHRHR